MPLAPGLLIDNTKFVNFNRHGTAFGITSVQGLCTNKCGGYYYQVKGWFDFVNAQRL